MRLDELSQAIRDFEAALVALGVSRDAARKASTDAETVAVADMLETQRDVRLLDLFEQVGCAKLAERHGVTTRTIYTRREEALSRLQEKKLRRFASDNASQEVA